ncbi:recombinase family protein [Heyndrickxia acidicola]|uniref:Recombinase family protein n=1 Tax=Heyndrickxia acidicola TaxID=209389 RepID=A0ABU6MGL1_9BACI|nr:recombinase family protein [Heyndrickxia acidicola]MED1203527.1 recombinase family protein [Heyndrickxia acidicola]
MSKTVAYIRVSSKEQNLSRQIDEMKKLGLEEKYIYEDKASGKDMDRIGYQYMKKSLEKGDLLVVKSIDRIGRNSKEIMKEWQEITHDLGADIKVIDMPLLDTTQQKDLLVTFVSDIVLQILAFVSEKERANILKRQAEGIAAAKARGKHLGRPRKEIPVEFPILYKQWKNGKIMAVEFMKTVNMTNGTFYQKVKEYEKSLSVG